MQAAASAAELRSTWAQLEKEATANSDEAVHLEEQAVALERGGRSVEVRVMVVDSE